MRINVLVRLVRKDGSTLTFTAPEVSGTAELWDYIDAVLRDSAKSLHEFARMELEMMTTPVKL